jgi:hypothetical protein
MATGVVNTPSLNVRDQPNGQVIDLLTFGATVTTLTTDESGNWLLIIAVIDGVTRVGWVLGEFIDATNGHGQQPAPLQPPSTLDKPQPPPSDDGSVFDPNNWTIYTGVLGNRESGNKYDSVNQLGYSGRWQFGAGALCDCGYVKQGSKNSDLKSASAWLGLNSVFSLGDWLSDSSAQDSAMLEYTKGHYNSLLKAGGLNAASSVARCAGLLASAHLVGVGGAMSLVHGTVQHDANGVTSAQYYSLLSKAFGGTGVLEA